MATSSTIKQQLSMSGEYGVCSELCKRGLDVSLTMGNAKAIDIFVKGSNGTYKTIEVKTSRSKRFVTGFFQKYGDKSKLHPDYWVLVHIDKNNISHYYILTHDEMGQVQMARNGMTEWGPVEGGVDNVLLANVAAFEDQWHKIA